LKKCDLGEKRKNLKKQKILRKKRKGEKESVKLRRKKQILRSDCKKKEKSDLDQILRKERREENRNRKNQK